MLIPPSVAWPPLYVAPASAPDVVELVAAFDKAAAIIDVVELVAAFVEAASAPDVV